MAFFRESGCRVRVVIGAAFLAAGLVHADRADYNRIKNILVENGVLSVLHHHDWSFDQEKRSKLMRYWSGPFQPANVFAYVECIDRRVGRVLFKRPSPPLTYLWISEDSRFIVGLSEIKLDNPVQLVIFDKGGRLLKKRRISAREAELSKSEYDDFVRRFPSAAASLLSRDGVVLYRDHVYIDPASMGTVGYSDEAWEYMAKKMVASHFSRSFSESTSNWIWWYKRSGPDIRLSFAETKLMGISLLDPDGVRFEIPIVEEFCR